MVPEGKDVEDIETLRVGRDLVFREPVVESSKKVVVVVGEEEEREWRERIRRELGEEYVDDPYFGAEESFERKFRRRKGGGNDTVVEGTDDSEVDGSSVGTTLFGYGGEDSV